MDEKSKQRLTTIIAVAFIVVVFGSMAWLYLSRCNNWDCPSVVDFVSSFGPWAPVMYAALYIASAPIPYLATVLSVASGLLFGPFLGTLYTVIIAPISALIPYTLARRLGQEWVESKLKGKKLEGIYQQSESSSGFLFVLLMRLIPVLPWEVQNYAAGLTKVGPLTFLSATVLGIIPGTFSFAFLGSAVSQPGSWQFWAAIGLNVVAFLVPTIVVSIRKLQEKRLAAQKVEHNE